ncbi:hypothetical protein [Olivibacter sitiensis]|uniref:hypothetical protein n=1 Tax=Olivibacter sitiensis TaxID=376470 RepID=UPI000484AA82|nr:hypothetical protein [Olivibacter sitiensis]
MMKLLIGFISLCLGTYLMGYAYTTPMKVYYMNTIVFIIGSVLAIVPIVYLFIKVMRKLFN